MIATLKNGKARLCAVICAFIMLIALLSSYPFAHADDLTGDGPVISESYLRGIEEELLCSELKKAYTESAHGCSYDLYSLKGTYINPNDVAHLVSTGDYIKDGKGNRYTVVVTGDVDGNGTIDVSDTAAIKLHFAKKITLQDATFEAGDANNDGKITATDYIRIKFHIQVKYNIHENESFDPDQSEEESEYSYDESGWTSGWM